MLLAIKLPIILSSEMQVYSLLAIGFAIAVVLIAPACILLGMQIKREAPSIRRRLVLVDKLECDKAKLEVEISQLKQVIALNKADKLKADALLSDAMGLIRKVIG